MVILYVMPFLFILRGALLSRRGDTQLTVISFGPPHSKGMRICIFEWGFTYYLERKGKGIGMSAKTKIVVLHMKELIYTGIFAALGILFIILLLVMFLPGKDAKEEPVPVPEDKAESAAASGSSLYIPGIYTTELVLGGEAVDVEVIVDKDGITSIRMVNLSEAVTTMYPLLQPTFDTICEQVYEKQSLEGISYSTDNKYTSLVLLEAIRNSLEKASASPEAAGTISDLELAEP